MFNDLTPFLTNIILNVINCDDCFLTNTKGEIFVLYIHDICIVILSLPAVSALSTNSQSSSSSSSLDEPSSKVNAKSLVVVLFFYDLRILIITC